MNVLMPSIAHLASVSVIAGRLTKSKKVLFNVSIKAAGNGPLGAFYHGMVTAAANFCRSAGMMRPLPLR